MTDNDIIKALEIHADNEAGCSECPIYHSDTGDTCAYELAQNALDLITRQKADYLRLEKAYIKNQEIFADQCLENERLKAEIERLKKAGEEAASCFNRMQSLYNIKCVELKVAKNQAITEFEERLSDTKFKQGNDYIIYADNVSTVAKEMKEGVNNA
jgi:hypothetical protein